MNELELRLRALGEELAYPATPPLALDLARRRRPRGRHLAVALALAALLAAGVLALSPGARSAFLELFHLPGATVARVDELPPVERIGRLELIGAAVGRAEAERRLGFRLLDLGEPDEIHLRGEVATLVYGDVDRPRLLLSETRATVWDQFVKKAAGSETRVEEVTVAGAYGLFLSGAGHDVMFRDSSGEIVAERAFLAGTTLLWNRGDLLLRLEADVGRDEAVALAESVR